MARTRSHDISIAVTCSDRVFDAIVALARRDMLGEGPKNDEGSNEPRTVEIKRVRQEQTTESDTKQTKKTLRARAHTCARIMGFFAGGFLGVLALVGLVSLVVVGLGFALVTCANPRWEPRRRGKTETLRRCVNVVNEDDGSTAIATVRSGHLAWDAATHTWHWDADAAAIAARERAWVVKPERYTTHGLLVHVWTDREALDVWLADVVCWAPRVARHGFCVQPFVPHAQTVRVWASRPDIHDDTWRLDAVDFGPAVLLVDDDATTPTTKPPRRPLGGPLGGPLGPRANDSDQDNGSLGTRLPTLSEAERAAWSQFLTQSLRRDLRAVAVDALVVLDADDATNARATALRGDHRRSFRVVEINGAMGTADRTSTAIGPRAAVTLGAFLWHDGVPWFFSRARLGAENVWSGQCAASSDCGPGDAWEAWRVRSEAKALAAIERASPGHGVRTERTCDVRR